MAKNKTPPWRWVVVYTDVSIITYSVYTVKEVKELFRAHGFKGKKLFKNACKTLTTNTVDRTLWVDTRKISKKYRRKG